MRTSKLRTAMIAVTLLGGACRNGPEERGEEPAPNPPETVVIASTEAAETQIVGQMFVRILEDADYEADAAAEYASQSEVLAALEAGEAHAAPLYLASLARELDPDADLSGDPLEVRALVEPLLENRGLAVLDPASVNSGEALVVPADTAERNGLRTVGDLAQVAGRLTFGAPEACGDASWCLPGFEDVYGVEFRRFEPIDDPADALEQGEVDVALLPATSARIREERWVVLEDDRQLLPPENLTPVVRRDVLVPDLASLLNAVSGSLDPGELTVYNRSIEFGESPGTIAILHLNNERLLGGIAAGTEDAPVIGEAPPAGCTDARGQGEVEVTAVDRAFDVGCLIVSADDRITLVNQEALPHTFTITEDTSYRPPFLLDLDESLGNRTVTSEPVGGSLEAGGYPFVCRYHVWMAGQIWVQ
jgi:osmoprotectant transport system substrate-binding protein